MRSTVDGVTLQLTEGAVLSILKVALSLSAAVLPATSVQLSDVTLTAEPSPLVVLDWTFWPGWDGKAVWQEVLKPEPESLASKRFGDAGVVPASRVRLGSRAQAVTS